MRHTYWKRGRTAAAYRLIWELLQKSPDELFPAIAQEIDSAPYLYIGTDPRPLRGCPFDDADLRDALTVFRRSSPNGGKNSRPSTSRADLSSPARDNEALPNCGWVALFFGYRAGRYIIGMNTTGLEAAAEALAEFFVDAVFACVLLLPGVVTGSVIARRRHQRPAG